MINIEAVYISGFFLFLAASIFFIVLYFFKIYLGEKKIKKYLRDHGDHASLNKGDIGIIIKDKKGRKGEIPLSLFILRWSRFSWVFFCLFTITMLLTLLYAALWLGQGLSLTPTGLITTWGRWLIFSISSIIVVSCYMYSVSKIRYTVQGFFSVFHGFLSMLFILSATLSQTRGTSILWMVASLISAFFTALFMLFPVNTLLRRNYRYGNGSNSKKSNTDRRFSWKRTVFVSAIVLAYWLYFTIWVLSKSNEITTVLDFGAENLSYLIIDIVMVYVILMYLVWIMFKRTNEHKKIIMPTQRLAV